MSNTLANPVSQARRQHVRKAVYEASPLKSRATKAEMEERTEFLIDYAEEHGPVSAQFHEEIRHYCRNPKCRSKLPSPVSNPRRPSAHVAAIAASIASDASSAKGRWSGNPSSS
jgi:hypothetical protein